MRKHTVLVFIFMWVVGFALAQTDKTATPTLTTTEVQNGAYIYYTIRFQNFTSDTVDNIIISDTLSSQLEPATLQMLNTTHLCNISQEENAYYFQFQQIKLPSFQTNENLSHGFILFRVKPRAEVEPNTLIYNRASVYFDFTTVVGTNTAITKIVSPGSPLPVNLTAFFAKTISNNVVGVNWQTENEINISGYDVELSYDGRNFSKTGEALAKGQVRNNYTSQVQANTAQLVYLRLKIKEQNGIHSFGPVFTLRNTSTIAAITILSNPVKDVLRIAIIDPSLRKSYIRLLNVQGAVVKTLLLQNDIEQISVTGLPAGIYFLQTSKGSYRFVKQ